MVISQTVQAGAPVIWGGSPSAFDMRHGTTPMGSIDTMLIDLGYAEIRKHLNLPTHVYIGMSDAKLWMPRPDWNRAWAACSPVSRGST